MSKKKKRYRSDSDSDTNGDQFQIVSNIIDHFKGDIVDMELTLMFMENGFLNEITRNLAKLLLIRIISITLCDLNYRKIGTISSEYLELQSVIERLNSIVTKLQKKFNFRTVDLINYVFLRTQNNENTYKYK